MGEETVRTRMIAPTVLCTLEMRKVIRNLLNIPHMNASVSAQLELHPTTKTTVSGVLQNMVLWRVQGSLQTISHTSVWPLVPPVLLPTMTRIAYSVEWLVPCRMQTTRCMPVSESVRLVLPPRAA